MKPSATRTSGKGSTILNGEIFQLTYNAQIGFVYDPADFRPRRRFSCQGEGWGLTNDGRDIYMSDGARPVTGLNELEWIDGEIFANVYQTDRIARIAPRTGQVTEWIDLSGLLSPVYRNVDVLNGIAYDRAGHRIFVTGKLWPNIYHMELLR